MLVVALEPAPGEQPPRVVGVVRRGAERESVPRRHRTGVGYGTGALEGDGVAVLDERSGGLDAGERRQLALGRGVDRADRDLERRAAVAALEQRALQPRALLVAHRALDFGRRARLRSEEHT